MAPRANKPDDRIRIMGHIDNHHVDYAVREMEVDVHAVVPAGIVEFVRAVPFRNRTGSHKLRRRLLELSSQARVLFHNASVVRLEGRFDLNLEHRLFPFEERHESVDVVERRRVVGNDAQLLRFWNELHHRSHSDVKQCH